MSRLLKFEAWWKHRTGLKDKNGKEIYEGDILDMTEDDCVVSGVVEWDNIECGWILTSNNSEKKITYMLCYEGERCEVIGNIYENPELLNN